MPNHNLKIVTHGWLADQFYHWVTSHHPEIEIQLAKDRENLMELVQHSNAFAGFHELDNCDVSGLDWIHSFGAGVDAFLSNLEILKHQIPISRTTGELGRKIGEYCLGHVLNIYQNIDQYRNAQQESIWKPKRPKQLKEAEILILGTGSIGVGIAQVFCGLTNNIVGVNSRGRKVLPFDHNIELGAMIPRADIIINTLPKTPETDGLINRQFFESFEASIFINVGRGSTVVHQDLIMALNNGNISFAVLDVFEEEPLTKSSALWNHPKTVITPHVSGLTTLDDITSSFEVALKQFQNRQRDAFVKYQTGY